MSRTIINFWLDLTLLVTFSATAWLTAVLRFVFPPATATAGWTLWGATYEQWFAIQFWAVCLLALLVIIHVMLHWTWVCGVVVSRMLPDRDGKKRQLSDGVRTLYGVGLLVAVLHILGIALFVAGLAIQSPT